MSEDSESKENGGRLGPDLLDRAPAQTVDSAGTQNSEPAETNRQSDQDAVARARAGRRGTKTVPVMSPKQTHHEMPVEEPGAVAMYSPTSEAAALSQMEQDAEAKARAGTSGSLAASSRRLPLKGRKGTMGGASYRSGKASPKEHQSPLAEKPGAVAIYSSNANSEATALAQMEQDAEIKARGATPVSFAASSRRLPAKGQKEAMGTSFRDSKGSPQRQEHRLEEPGAVALFSPTSEATALSQLEQDAEAKARGATPGSMTASSRRLPVKGRKGAMGTSFRDSPSSPQKQHRPEEPGAVAVYSPASEASALSQLEEDAEAKARGETPGSMTISSRRLAGKGRKGAMGSSFRGKASARSLASDSLSPKASSRPKAAAVPVGAVPATGTNHAEEGKVRASVMTLEDDVASKIRASKSPATPLDSPPVSRKGSHVPISAASVAGAFAMAGPNASMIDDVRDEDIEDDFYSDQEKDDVEEPPGPPGTDVVDEADYEEAVQPTVSTPTAPRSRRNQDTEQPSAMTFEDEPFLNGTHDDVAASNIEAFVAPNQVVDATGVAAVLSEEEEKEMEKKRFRRLVMYGSIAIVVIIVIVVIAVAVTLSAGRGNASRQPTEAPSTSPTPPPTPSPTSLRLSDFIASVIPISGAEVFQDTSSPQYRAALWVAEEDELQLPINFFDDRLFQRYFMATFYFSTDGDGAWVECSRTKPCISDTQQWMTGTHHECGWFAVTCDDEFKVNTLVFQRLAGAGLSGVLPLELFYLSELVFVALANSFLRGTIPTTIGLLTNLNRLWLQGNALQGTIPGSTLAKLTELRELLLSSNFLTGQIPVELGQMSSLVEFEAFNNRLGGALPEFPNLTLLDISRNNFNGTIPERFLESAANMESLSLSLNSFTGIISSSIESMTQLQFVNFSHNQFTGSIADEFFTLPNLRVLDISGCMFSGPLSETIGNSVSIQDLLLENNELIGELPVALDSLAPQLRRVTLNGNGFTGNISEAICQFTGESVFQDIVVLTADCATGDLACVCCTECF